MTSRKGAASKRPFYAALALIALAGTGAIAYVATRPERGTTVTMVDPNAPPAQAEGYLLGDPNAPVQIIEFADFECPACERFASITAPDVKERIVKAGLASYRFYDFPLPQHRNSMNASLAAACAADQGKFWEMHDRIFAGQPDWAGRRDPQALFEEYAESLGLNVDVWEECYESRRHEARIRANKAEGERRQISQTPSFIIGDRMVAGAIPYDELKALVDSARAEAASRPSTPAVAPAPTAAPAGNPR